MIEIALESEAFKIIVNNITFLCLITRRKVVVSTLISPAYIYIITLKFTFS